MNGGMAQEQDPIDVGFQAGVTRCEQAGIDVDIEAVEATAVLLREIVGELGTPSPLALGLFSEVLGVAATARAMNGEPALATADIVDFGFAMSVAVNSLWHE